MKIKTSALEVIYATIHATLLCFVMYIFAELISYSILFLIDIFNNGILSSNKSIPLITSGILKVILLLSVYKKKKNGYSNFRFDMDIKKYSGIIINIIIFTMCKIFLINGLLYGFLKKFNSDKVEQLKIFSTLGSKNNNEFLLMIIYVCIIVPLYEELLFRKFVLNFLNKRLDSTISIIAGAFIFAVFHWEPSSVIITFISGVLYSFVYEKSGSIKSTIFMHSLTNLCAAVIFLMGYDPVKYLMTESYSNYAFIIIATIFSLLIGIHSLILFERKSKYIFS